MPIRVLPLCLAVTVASSVFGCPNSEVEPTGREYFEQNVVAELQQTCGSTSCHGVALDQYDAREPGWYTLALDPDGTIQSTEAIQVAYDESLGNITGEVDPTKFGGTLSALDQAIYDRVDLYADPVFSLLVRKPIPEGLDGLPHKGGDNYVSLQSEGLQKILTWLEMERFPDSLELTALEEQFADTVMPALARKGCLSSSCHGPTVANPLKLDAGVGGRFSGETIRRNHKVTLHQINPNAALSEHRLLKKVLPIAEGGIAHRGGNDFFTSAQDTDRVAIQAWIEAERLAEGPADPLPTGLVFVRRPPGPRDYFDVGAWQPGADIWLLQPVDATGTLTNLTAALHTNPADVRTPHVSPDGESMLFSMRDGPTDCLNIYSVALDGSGLTPLTADSGCQSESFGPTHANAANLSPQYASDDRVYFVSTRGGTLADKGRNPATSIWSMLPDGSDQRRVTQSHGHETDPTVNHEGQLIVTSLRDIGLETHASLFTFPPNWYTNYHPHFGNQSKYPIFAQTSELADFREIVALQSLDGQFAAGALAVIDRNMGPDIEDPNEISNAGLPGFIRALSVLSDDAVALGTGTAELWRDPVALPDGRFVAAHSSAAVDPTDPGAVVDFGLVIGALGLDPTTKEATLGTVESLVDEPGMWEVEPDVVAARSLPHLRPTYLQPDDMPAGTGTVRLFDVITIESLLRNIAPTGRVDKVRTDITGLRVVVGAPATPEDMVRPDPGSVRNGDPASTLVSNGIHGRRWSIGPAPVSPDGSLYVRLPANVAVYLQTVNADGMAVGMHHDRWIFLNEGEPLGFGVSTPTFDQFCGGCHGAFSGDPSDSIGTFDLLTSASVTQATHNEFEEPIDPVDATQPALFNFLSFDSDIQPVLEQSCATGGCHSAADSVAGLDLSTDGGGTYAGVWSNGYESLMATGTGSGDARAGAWQKELVDERGARADRSYLMEKISNRELNAPRTLSGALCAAPTVLSDAEKAMIAHWIDLGATYLGVPAP